MLCLFVGHIILTYALSYARFVFGFAPSDYKPEKFVSSMASLLPCLLQTHSNFTFKNTASAPYIP